MALLFLGLFIWVAVHLFPSVLAESRTSLISRLGENAYKGLFSLCIVAALLLIVFGWRSAVPIQVYIPPTGLRQLAIIAIVIGLILFVSANFPATRIKRVLRHPQLTGVAIWAIAHLTMNGDSRSVLLFSTILVWSLVSMLTINRRDGAWIKPKKPDGWGQDIIILVAGLVISVLAFYFHEYLSGISLVA